MTAADWSALESAIAGDVVLPGAADYERQRTPAIAGFEHVRPQAIVRCRMPDDVAEALALARRERTPIAARSGGHCFAGRSSTPGLLIDVSPMSTVAVGEGRVTAGAGATLGDLYTALDAHDVTIAGGCGPTVGIAGLALGGGLGILGRTYGLTCDQVVASQVVLADGSVVDCDEHHDSDLFWALRGAGGCRFGVVTSLVLDTVPAPAATSFALDWPREAAATVVAAWQDWAPDAPEGVAASLLATASADPDVPVAVTLFGAAVGSEAQARATLSELVARTDVDPTSATFVALPYRETKHYLAEHHPASGAKPDPAHLFAKSEFFRAPLPADTIAALLEHLAADRMPGCARELDFSPWGGAYNRVAPAATAFPHRAERFLLKHEVTLDPACASAARPAARAWLMGSWALAHPWGTGGAYANFADPDLGAWDPAYHGANLPRLLEAKARYDPGHLFSGDAPTLRGHL